MDLIGATNLIPGPNSTELAIHLGYERGLATIGIFLPSFLLVWAITPIVSRLRNSSWISGMLDGINIASLVLMAVAM